MASEVASALLNRALERTPATLRGFRRHRIRHQVFPAIIPTHAESDVVEGWIVSGLSDEELEIFDEFEDVEYYRDSVKVTTEGGHSRNAFVYVWKDAGRHLLYGNWDYDEFQEKHLEKYLTMCCRSSGHPNEVPSEAAVAP